MAGICERSRVGASRTMSVPRAGADGAGPAGHPPATSPRTQWPVRHQCPTGPARTGRRTRNRRAPVRRTRR